jgi:hypothetical protein
LFLSQEISTIASRSNCIMKNSLTLGTAHHLGSKSGWKKIGSKWRRINTWPFISTCQFMIILWVHIYWRKYMFIMIWNRNWRC